MEINFTKNVLYFAILWTVFNIIFLQISINRPRTRTFWHNRFFKILKQNNSFKIKYLCSFWHCWFYNALKYLKFLNFLHLKSNLQKMFLELLEFSFQSESIDLWLAHFGTCAQQFFFILKQNTLYSSKFLLILAVLYFWYH